MASEATGLGLSLGPSDPALVSGNELRPAVSEPLPQADAVENLRGGAGSGRKKENTTNQNLRLQMRGNVNSQEGNFLFVFISL